MLNLSGQHILVVEDEGMIAFTLEDALHEECDAIVSVVANLEAALAAVANTRYAAAILDINLGNGERSYPIARILQQQKVPFFYVTGYDRLPDDGCPPAQFVVKPYRFRTIEAMLAVVMDAVV